VQLKAGAETAGQSMPGGPMKYGRLVKKSGAKIE
jgi:hypothetical protein